MKSSSALTAAWHPLSRSLWGMLILLGAVIHFGTAFLRLDTFLPSPRLLDFAAYYGAIWFGWSGSSPYDWSAELLTALEGRMGFSIRPSESPNTPPIWLWLLQPLAFLPFSVAAWTWLCVLIMVTLWSTALLARLAGYRGTKAVVMLFPFVVSFGPVFLNLTLGQNSLFLLLAVLSIGTALHSPTNRAHWSAALAWTVAIAAKLFPVFWLAALSLLRQWRLLIAVVLLGVVTLGGHFVLYPVANQDYWPRLLVERVSRFAGSGDLDDQSLIAWLDRVGRPRSFNVPGLSVQQRHAVHWSPPWSFSAEAIRYCGLVLASLLGLIILATCRRVALLDKQAFFYVWVLYGLVVLPHTTRYNHVLLLPAMAWLWRDGQTGRRLAIIAYVLAALSRLNHLWAILLPAPWGPLASGFGLYAVLILSAGIIERLRNQQASHVLARRNRNGPRG